MSKTYKVPGGAQVPDEAHAYWWNTVQFGEPMLSRRNLKPTLSTNQAWPDVAPLAWVLNFSDGKHNLLAIAERSGLPIADLVDAASRLEAVGLLEPFRPLDD